MQIPSLQWEIHLLGPLCVQPFRQCQNLTQERVVRGSSPVNIRRVVAPCPTPAVPQGRHKGGGSTWLESPSRPGNRDRLKLKPWNRTWEDQKESRMPVSCTNWTCLYLLLPFFAFYWEDWKPLLAELMEPLSTLLQSDNSKTVIAKMSRKITFPFWPGMKNYFLILQRMLAWCRSVSGMKVAGGGRREGGKEV